MDDRKPLNDLLVRWHRWSADPSLSADKAMAEFDALVGTLWPCSIAALIVEARNLSCGVAVWSSVRAKGVKNHSRARWALMQHLRRDQTRWFGGEIVHFNARGNRIGQSNPQAKSADRDVELCVQMRDQVDEAGQPVYSLGQLAQRFKVSKSTVQAWCDGSRRGQSVARAMRTKAGA